MRSLCLFVGLALAVAGAENSVAPQDREAAAKAAESWVEAFSAGDHAAAWKQSALAFKARSTQDSWVALMEKIERESGLGRPVSHKQTGRAVKETPPDVGKDDRYISVEFELTYEKGRASLVLTPVLEPDGSWRVLGFSWRKLDGK